TLSWVTDGDVLTEGYTSGTVAYGTAITAPNTPTKTGYVFAGWHNGTSVVTPATTMPAANTTYTAIFEARDDIQYTVKHYQQNLEDDDYTEMTQDEQHLEGTTGEPTYAEPQAYTGFTPKSFEQGTVAADGSTVVEIYYDRIEYTITWWDAQATLAEHVIEEQTYRYGATPSYTYNKPDDDNYTYVFEKWTPNIVPVTGNTTYTAHYNPIPHNMVVVNNDTIPADVDLTSTTVKVTGALHVAESATLNTNNFILEGSDYTSGELTGNVAAANVYFDVTRTKSEGESFTEKFGARIWYAVAVPWEVSVPAYQANGGVYRKSGDQWIRMTLGSDYDLIYYNGALRYSQGEHTNDCWRYVEDDQQEYSIHTTMQPGKAYMIYMTNATDSIRFEKAYGAALHTTTTSVVANGGDESDNPNAGWNGIANPATYHAFLNAGTGGTGYRFIPGIAPRDGGRYMLVSTTDSTMVVGQSVYVKVTAANDNIPAQAHQANLAPRRVMTEAARETRYVIELTKNGTPEDRIFIQTTDEKADKYEDGKDLPKISLSTSHGQMWVNRYEQKLSINSAVVENGTTNFPLGLFAPQNGEYMLRMTSEIEPGDALFVTLNGNIIWDLSASPYPVTLENGTTLEYGLLLVRNNAPTITTDVEHTQEGDTQCVRKYLINNNVYILRGGEMYTITGAKVDNNQ
ncbi:MAG: InlB B-repeat-containing protein, partial [Paludibacteraceae bacterium]|nr:InlB B-repeat-containing protein [Paludibacteraceae bacterium]